MPSVNTADAAEEWIDARLHRPLAQSLVRRLVATPVTPNQLTGFACLVGVLSALSLLLGATRPAFRLLAGALLLAAVVLDCADGQLARARQAASKTGDMLDGLADVVVGMCVMTAVTYVAALESQASWVWWLGAIAVVSEGVQCSLFDFTKRAYLSRVGIRPLPDDRDLAHALEASARARRERRWGEAFLWRFYTDYFGTQRAVIGLLRRLSIPEPPPRRMQRWSWLGLGTHLALLYTAMAASALWPPALVACLLIFSVVQNAWLVALLAR